MYVAFAIRGPLQRKQQRKKRNRATKTAADLYADKTQARYGTLTPLRDKHATEDTARSAPKGPTATGRMMARSNKATEAARGRHRDDDGGTRGEHTYSGNVGAQPSTTTPARHDGLGAKSSASALSSSSSDLPPNTRRRGSTSSDPGNDAGVKFKQGVQLVQNTIVKPQLQNR
jgi:hypothetical protein